MQFRKVFIVAVAALACLSFSTESRAQRGGSVNGSKLQLLGNSVVREELGIVEDQTKDLEDFRSMSRDSMREVYSGMREKFQNLSREERDELSKQLQERMNEKLGEVSGKLGDVLLPHQLERLDQIALQQVIRQRGFANTIENSKFKEVLGLDESDTDKLKEKEEEVKKDLIEKIKKLRAEAQKEIISVLPVDKQTEMKELLGDYFEIPADSWRRDRERGGRGGAGGGRGGPGGGRGGPGGGRGGPGGGDRGGDGGEEV